MTLSAQRFRARARTAAVIRAAWLLVAAVSAAVWFGGPLSEWTALQTVCYPDSACQSFQLDPDALATLHQHGISLAQFAVGICAILAMLWLLWFGVGSMIIFRRADDRGALLSAFFLAFLPIWSLDTWVQRGWLNNLIFAASVSSLFLFGLLFPDARFRPMWTRWLALGIVVFMAGVNLPLPVVLNLLLFLMFISLFFAVVAVQIYRYRTISSWEQRQQTKWAVFGLAVALLGLLASWVLEGVAPFPTGNGSLAGAITNNVGIAIVLSVIPLSIGISVLRNRLWDIDHVINRALVYTTLTLVLAGIYIGGVLGLEALFRLIVGSSSTVAIAISTLAIVVLFGPVRRQIQTLIDRRFYRRKYDAERTLSVFGERVRDEVDLTRLSQGLTAVVRDTLQPEHVSLWLRGEEPWGP